MTEESLFEPVSRPFSTAASMDLEKTRATARCPGEYADSTSSVEVIVTTRSLQSAMGAPTLIVAPVLSWSALTMEPPLPITPPTLSLEQRILKTTSCCCCVVGSEAECLLSSSDNGLPAKAEPKESVASESAVNCSGATRKSGPAGQAADSKGLLSLTVDLSTTGHSCKQPDTPRRAFLTANTSPSISTTSSGGTIPGGNCWPNKTLILAPLSLLNFSTVFPPLPMTDPA
uniref:Uncharacterized protein n=1 Tax=Opuntia streptacantha TaxID=393608 RepID=A0A7C9A4V6_OPUST